MDATSLFSLTINEMKSGTTVWEDFILKATKFHSQLKSTILSSTAFLDSFQKVADMATSTRGGTKDIGSALTRLCLRHRSVEARLKTFTSSIMDCLILPLQDHLEEWKKIISQIDKEHAKEYRKLRQELKKKNFCEFSGSSTLKLKKHKATSLGNRCTFGTNLSKSIESMESSYNDKLILLENLEKSAVRRAMIEERSRICTFVNYISAVIEEELAIFQETGHLKEIIDSLAKLTSEPLILPSSCENIISDMKITSMESGTAWFHFNNLKSTPPSSPSSFGSRKSSTCSVSSFNSSSSGSTQSSHHSHYCYRSLSQPHVGPSSCRLSSISSQDSGFISQPDYSLLKSGTKVSKQNANLKVYVSQKTHNSCDFNPNKMSNNKISSLSEHSSGSNSNNSNPSQVKVFKPLDGNSKFFQHYHHHHHNFSTNQKPNCPLLSQTNFESNLNQTIHNSNTLDDENVVDETLINSSASLSGVQEAPLLPFRHSFQVTSFATSANSSLPNNRQTFCASQSSKNSYNPFFKFQEFSPVYANSNEMLVNEEVNKACSDGSITPTNAERSSSPSNELLCYPNSSTKLDIHNSNSFISSEQSKQIYSSTSTLNRSGKTPPLPPIRKTSSISDPNAITLGTLKNADMCTYEEIKTLKRNMTNEIYEEIKKMTKQKQETKKPNSMSTSLTSLSEPIYSALEIPLSFSLPSEVQILIKKDDQNAFKSDYNQAKCVFETLISKNKTNQEVDQRKLLSNSSSTTTLPPPPESINHCSHSEKIFNHFSKSKNEFLQTLNAKLAAPQMSSRLSPKILKKENSYLSHFEDNWDSKLSSYQTSNKSDSIAQSMLRCFNSHNSMASFSLPRQKSDDSSQNNSLQW